MKQKIGKSAKLLIICDMIYTFISIFSKTFLVAYFLQVSNESITKIAIYYIIIYLSLGIGNNLLLRVIKKSPSKSKKILSSGIITKAIFILFIVILSDRIADYFVLIALLYGISESLYWSVHELIYIDVTTNDNRKKFMTVKKIASKIVNIVVPIILGSSIQLFSFTKIAAYVLVLSAVQIVVSLLIKTNLINNKEGKKYSFKEFSKYLNENEINKVKRYACSGIAYGIVESSISTLIVIITIMTFKTSFNLGVLTTIFSFCSMIALILYNKFYNKNSKIVLYICAIAVLLGVIGLLIDINRISLVIYNFCYTVSFCVFDVVYNTKKGNLIEECGLQEYREEYIAYSSIALCTGRILGYVFMLIVSFYNNILYFKILLGVVTIFAPVYSNIMSNLESKKINEKERS